MYEQRKTINVRASGLGKRYGDLWALRDLDLEVESGKVLGLLGHNGAGKTTAIRLLTTLALPTEGTRARSPATTSSPTRAAVRSRIGVANQAATVDGLMSGRANLEMVGRLYHLPAVRSASAPTSCSRASASRTPATASSRTTREGCAAGSTSQRRSSPLPR